MEEDLIRIPLRFADDTLALAGARAPAIASNVDHGGIGCAVGNLSGDVATEYLRRKHALRLGECTFAGVALLRRPTLDVIERSLAQARCEVDESEQQHGVVYPPAGLNEACFRAVGSALFVRCEGTGSERFPSWQSLPITAQRALIGDIVCYCKDLPGAWFGGAIVEPRSRFRPDD